MQLFFFFSFLQLYLEPLGGNGLFCLRDVRSVLEFDVGEPAFQHLLHLQNDINVFAPERHRGKEGRREARETQKERGQRSDQRATR